MKKLIKYIFNYINFLADRSIECLWLSTNMKLSNKYNRSISLDEIENGTKEQEKKMSELKPCPFCNSETVFFELQFNDPAIRLTEQKFIICCSICDLEVRAPTTRSRMGLIKKWNTRIGNKND